MVDAAKVFQIIEVVLSIVFIIIMIWFLFKSLNGNLNNDDQAQLQDAVANENNQAREAAMKDPLSYFDGKVKDIVGLEKLKKEIRKFIERVIVQKKENIVLGKSPSVEVVPNFVFTGPPGTGKTMYGKILSQMLYYLGIVRNSSFTVVHAQQLIGKYVGWTENTTAKILSDCAGGVVFIDEAYQLVGSGYDLGSADFGRKALEVIMNYATPGKKDRPIIILAGYEEDIEKMFSVNQGFSSRFPKSGRFYFDNYNATELFRIGMNKILSEQCKITQHGYKTFLEVIERNIAGFASQNARLIESFIQQIHTERQSRVFEKKGELLTIETIDILNAEKVFFNSEK